MMIITDMQMNFTFWAMIFILFYVYGENIFWRFKKTASFTWNF
jgi:hypothetical protein